MGDKMTLAKARQELEDLYLGVPDESVNVTLKDFANLQQNGVAERKTSNLKTIQENPSVSLKGETFMAKSPSLDFAKGLQAARDQRHVEDEIYRDHTTPDNSRRNKAMRNMVDSSMAYDDMSIMSRAPRSPYEDRGGRRRPGIPHTNICTVCSEYIYIFRHRCLVCGRVYCRQCVGVGMGEMPEGRKCIECLGRRFSQRYIQRAGKVGCCSRYPSIVKQQELKWAEKGPRKSGERRHGRSGMVSRSASPVIPRTPTRAHVSSPPSFVMGSPFSHHHPLPF
ncbi:uncharacterized protein LOC131222279 [Magnolia sinica]|uniref:uncharacterized protein LOC131222279 n=1 Tax=Magnolia sinica TaxID=86752 RepID=UPI0026583089|nr:uncharacterized protein LOC131222279 [Magnolia sinica]